MVSKLWCQACNEVVDLERNEQGRETDPHGTDAHSPGAKLDAGKNRLGLVLGAFAGALTEVGKVGTYGANKYTDNGWLSVPDGHARYTDAMYRHLLSEAKGEEYDPDTGIRHAAHAAWNALARLELALREVRGQ
ncbi:MAG: dATP/dGTP diphosphohydrolase domain-containing protein [Spongiibacter sp.]|nr:dATP/dGTP diphosphohydrolase domain-containing protein [Spongiibacter sp.]